MADILLVEDYPGLQELYSTVLTAAGHTVRVAGSGTEALTITRDYQPDLILLDLLLPGVGGLGFLRNYKKPKQTKIVILTNLSSQDAFQEAQKLGVSDYLTKIDFTPKQLAVRLQKILD